jgi:hypothetical protein
MKLVLALLVALLPWVAGMPAAAPVPVRPLPFLHDLYTFRGTAGTAVVVAYAIEAGELLRESAGDGVRYRFDVSLVLADTAARTVINRHDSVHVVVPRQLAGDHLLFTTIEVEAAPSTSTLKRVYMYNATAPGIGQLDSSPFIIPDYSGTHLMLSDIALAQPDVRGGWPRGDVALALLPTGEFPGSAFEVYYEVYNMPRGHAYRTEIAVAEIGRGDSPRADSPRGDSPRADSPRADSPRADSPRADSPRAQSPRARTPPAHTGDRPLVRLSFTGEAPATRDATLHELRRVETSLPRGHYRVTVTVTDLETGEEASQSRTFSVHDRRYATMVPALPVTSSGFRR